MARVWAFVTGTHRPMVVQWGAPQIRKYADGSPMLATGQDDTLDAALARGAETKATPPARRSRAATGAAETEAQDGTLD